MIHSVELIPVLENHQLDEENNICLWPPIKKTIEINPNFNVKEYLFRVKTKEEYEEVKIINGLEELHLTLLTKNNVWEYQTDFLSTKNFLGFNLGVYELHLQLDSDKYYSLATLNNKQGILTERQLKYMYEYVAESEFFKLYLSNYYRTNTLAPEINNANTQHFWLSIALAYELHNEIDKFIRGELNCTNRINKKSVIHTYHSQSVIDEEDIKWLIDHPNELNMSSSGSLLLGGLPYDINRISQTVMFEDYDTYENRLLMSCLYSIKSTLSWLCEEYANTKLFPHSSVKNLITKTNKLIFQLNSKLNLLPPFNTLPEFSNKYLDDIRYVNLFSLISRWYNNLNYENELRSPILGITKIFEHYCFIKIIDCLSKNNFDIDEITLKNQDISGAVKLTRNNESIYVYYEPSISKKLNSPLKNSKAYNNSYFPDIVIIYKSLNVKKYGVIDAKFSDIKQIQRKLGHGEQIYYKYGLFLHTPNNQPLDYVFAMYPDIKDNCRVNYARDDYFINLKPALGCISIPFSDNSANIISKYLMPMIS